MVADHKSFPKMGFRGLAKSTTGGNRDKPLEMDLNSHPFEGFFERMISVFGFSVQLSVFRKEGSHEVYTHLPHFANKNLAGLHAFVERNSFATLVTRHVDGRMAAGHIPLLLERDGSEYGRLLGHVALAGNDQ